MLNPNRIQSLSQTESETQTALAEGQSVLHQDLVQFSGCWWKSALSFMITGGKLVAVRRWLMEWECLCFPCHSRVFWDSNKKFCAPVLSLSALQILASQICFLCHFCWKLHLVFAHVLKANRTSSLTDWFPGNQPSKRDWLVLLRLWARLRRSFLNNREHSESHQCSCTDFSRREFCDTMGLLIIKLRWTELDCSA